MCCITYWYVRTTHIQGRPQTLRHLYPGMGLKLVSLGFSRNQKYRSSSGLYVICIYCSLSVRTNTCKTPHGAQERSDHGRICFGFVFACVVGKNPKTANLSPMADDAITRGSVQVLGSPLHICGENLLASFNDHHTIFDGFLPFMYCYTRLHSLSM